MPVDFDNLDIDGAVNAAAAATDEKFSARIAELTRMTTSEVQELFPDAVDTEKLCQLMEIVKSSDDRNTKISNINENAKELSGVILTLLDKFV